MRQQRENCRILGEDFRSFSRDMSLEGQQLGEFEILERLGQGGMGAVYKARQRSLKRTVALKTLQAGLADDAEYIARFEQEAVAAAGLMHPNLVQVFSAGENDGLHWFAMEYVEGESAKARLKRKGRLDPLEAIAIAIHVATALEYGWRKAHLIHRDIKPDNIFLSEDGEVKLGDLGLAKSAGQTQGLTVTGHSMGTPHYISPEQVEAMKDVDLRADIYSLGCTLYHMLSGRVPFDGNSAVSIMMKHVNGPVPNLNDAWPECPNVLNDVVGKMMQKDPVERQQNYGEVITDLRRAYDLVSNPPIAEMAVPTPKPAAQPKGGAASKPAVPVKKSKLPLYAGIGVGVLMIAAVASFVFKPKEKQLTVALRRAQDHISSSPSPALEPGAIQLWNTPEKIPKEARNCTLQDGILKVDHGTIFTKERVDRDGILRASVRPDLKASDQRMFLRNNEHEFYSLRIDMIRQVADIMRIAGGSAKAIATWPLPQVSHQDEWQVWEFRAIGDELSASINGQILGSVKDSTVGASGSLTISSNGVSYFRDIVYVPLDRDENISTATKDAPFVNSLGMKFVPVPGTKVLFSIWDTRVQDYKAYAQVANVINTWLQQEKDGIPVSREPEYPVVGVSWDDVQGFNRWLTSKEVGEGKLPKGAKYRLPTDEEWSWAVGLPPELGATPAEKHQKNNVDYPWGKDYPPTKKVGNYADETFHAKFPLKKNEKENRIEDQWIEGYTDGYATTSPVGSFPANAYGLYDMGGNVWQWCEDWFDASHKDRVLRGAAWNHYDRIGMLSSSRSHIVPGYRYDGNGFRCVIELPEK